jgi:hypothetical protein
MPLPATRARSARHLWRAALVIATLAASLSIGTNRAAASDQFVDDDGDVHEAMINAVAEGGITVGCGPSLYCPHVAVNRAQMASFLVRALQLPLADHDYFPDDEGSVHEDAINAIAAAGITLGRSDGLFAPNDTVTRGQMAAFLARGFELGAAATDYFGDDTGSVFEDSINRLAADRITTGCAEGAARYCPNGDVYRDQMASFLARALGLDPTGTEYGSISGTVLDEAGHPLPRPAYYCVSVFLPDGVTELARGGGFIGMDGRYQLAIAPGSYKLLFFQCGADESGYSETDSTPYQQTWYGNFETPDESPVVTVGSGQRRVDIDAELPGGTFLYGRVTDEAGAPIVHAYINVYTAGQPHGVAYAVTSSTGGYRVSMRDGGDVQVSVHIGQDWRPEWYADGGWQADAAVIHMTKFVEATLPDIQLAPFGDADGDGLSDFDEFWRSWPDGNTPAPTNILDADSDHDGIDDGTEITNGTDPLTPQ